MPWLNKQEYKRIMEIEGENLRLDHSTTEYKDLLVKAKRRIDELEGKPDKYIRIKEFGKDDEQDYYRELVEILKNEAFQYFLYNFREHLVKEASECVHPNDLLRSMGKLSALEEMAGRMKAGLQAAAVIELEMDDEDE